MREEKGGESTEIEERDDYIVRRVGEKGEY